MFIHLKKSQRNTIARKRAQKAGRAFVFEAPKVEPVAFVAPVAEKKARPAKSATPAPAVESTPESPASWGTEAASRAGASHRWAAPGPDGVMKSLCGRELTAANLKPESDTPKRCSKCLKAMAK